MRFLCFTLLIFSSWANAESLGRLFTSQEERRALDNIRAETPIDEPSQDPTPRVATPIITNMPSEVRFSGFIKKADGTYAIWINGQSALSSQDSPIESAQFLTSPDAVLTTQGQQATMKPGQIWSLDKNTIREGYHIDRTPEVTDTTTSGL